MSDEKQCDAPTYPEPIKPAPLPNPDKQASVVVDELPEKGEEGIIYWLMKEGSDAYDLYQWVSNDWRKIDIDIRLYGNTGQNTDGAMTQKAVTDTINGLTNVDFTSENSIEIANGDSSMGLSLENDPETGEAMLVATDSDGVETPYTSKDYVDTLVGDVEASLDIINNGGES